MDTLAGSRNEGNLLQRWWAWDCATGIPICCPSQSHWDPDPLVCWCHSELSATSCHQDSSLISSAGLASCWVDTGHAPKHYSLPEGLVMDLLSAATGGRERVALSEVSCLLRAAPGHEAPAFPNEPHSHAPGTGILDPLNPFQQAGPDRLLGQNPSCSRQSVPVLLLGRGAPMGK